MSRLCQLGLAGLPRDCFHTCRTSTESVSSHLISSTSVCSDLSWNHSLSLCAAYLILCFVLFCSSDSSSIVLLIENQRQLTQHIIPDHTDMSVRHHDHVVFFLGRCLRFPTASLESFLRNRQPSYRIVAGCCRSEFRSRRAHFLSVSTSDMSQVTPSDMMNQVTVKYRDGDMYVTFRGTVLTESDMVQD